MENRAEAGLLTSGVRWIAWPRAFAAAAVVWAIALPLAAFAASLPHRSAALFWFAYGAYAVGGIICHQIDVRSFHLWSAALPVCARCTGIYVGAAIVALTGIAPRGRSERRATASDPVFGGRAADERTARVRRLLLLAMLPTAATLVYEWTTGVMPPNIIRALAGAPIGAAVAWIIREVN